MANYDYDVLFIGAGHGSDGAPLLAKAGYRVAKVEAERVGGTCTNWGCNAKLVLDGPVELTRQQERMAEVVSGSLTPDWAANMRYKHAVIDPLADGLADKFVKMGIDMLHGWATLVDPHTVSIDGQTKTADKIVIATGLHPNQIDVPGTELAHNSKDFLALDKLPSDIVIIGSGYIAMEFATIANQFGAHVTVMMHGDKALRKFYQPYAQAVVDDLSARGVDFISNANVSGFAKDGNQLTVKYGDGQSTTTNWILDATGRVPNVTGYGLAELGIDFDRHGIKVNDHLQTNIPNIFAAGDITATKYPNLTPSATFQSKYIARFISGDTSEPIEDPVIPSVTFTSPRIAEAGVSIAEAEASDQYQVVYTDLTKDWFRQVDHQHLAKQALVFDSQKRLVGATEMSEQADNAIDSLLPAIALKMNQQQIQSIIPLFPSITHEVWKKL
ncbi:NAD(P)/FAD-dependent oxidoreductase [Lactobacillus sp. Sy-1]|uniref:dihydrolipoyl dehydrogenase family protein n=1 Tax=Lactobacillus sp. Sy-1 TaxID=2109645 RepID=UPI001C55F2E1|nr:NAD(P)/FAD-dependent oxidoreductase [Lactobacillus sp. Sy-1]MBW1605111.1 NAD(P)/FAD-dependent oxidoreductase [Lactobacillus sp. Sy-1]